MWRERASNTLLTELNASTTIMQNNKAAPKKLKIDLPGGYICQLDTIQSHIELESQ